MEILAHGDYENRHCALLLPSLRVGGAERMMLNIATGLSKRGHDVDLLLVEATGDFLKQVPAEVNVVDLAASRVLTSFPGLVSYLRHNDPDVLLSTITPTNVIAGFAMLVPGIEVKIVIRVARPEFKAVTLQESTKKEQLTAALARHTYPCADEIVAISEGVADDLRLNTSLERVNVIYNPVVTKQLEQQAGKPVDHPWFSKDIPVVLGVGRLVEEKDFETLIRAFTNLRDQRNAKLVIYGDGHKRPELELFIKKLGIEEDVDLPGFTDNPYKYMAKADVFVNSAKHEGFGNVIIESMATGTPIVATDCPGAPAELLEYGTYGQLVPVGNPEAMANGINDMLDNPTNPELLYERAKEFAFERAIEQYLAVFSCE